MYVGEVVARTWTVGEIPRGFAGTRATVATMRQLANAGSLTRRIRETARRLIAGTMAYDKASEVRALHAFVRDAIRYTADPVHAELVQAPDVTLETGAGDCDDKATLLSALLQSVGHRVRYVLAKTNPTRPGVFSHVYLEALVSGRWVPLETIVPGAPVGFRPRSVGSLFREG